MCSAGPGIGAGLSSFCVGNGGGFVPWAFCVAGSSMSSIGMNYFTDQSHSLRFFHSVSRTFVPITIPKALHQKAYEVMRRHTPSYRALLKLLRWSLF